MSSLGRVRRSLPWLALVLSLIAAALGWRLVPARLQPELALLCGLVAGSLLPFSVRTGLARRADHAAP